MGNGVSVITVSTDVSLDSQGVATRSATRAEAFGMLTSRDGASGRETSHAYVVEFPERERRRDARALLPPAASGGGGGDANTRAAGGAAEAQPNNALARVPEALSRGNRSVMRVQTIPMGAADAAGLPMPNLARSLGGVAGGNALVTNGATEALEERDPTTGGTRTRGFRHTQHIVYFTPPGTTTETPSASQALPGQLVRSTYPPQDRLLSLAESLFHALEELDDTLNSAAVASAARKAVRPAPVRQIKAMPMRMWTNNTKGSFSSTECYICLCEYECGDSIRLLPCGHEFHAGCVDKWLTEMHRVCPLCRSDVCEPTLCQPTSPTNASSPPAPRTPTGTTERRSVGTGTAPSPSAVRRLI